MSTTRIVLGPFETGDQPTVTATVTDIAGGGGTSTDCVWTIVDPAEVETTYASSDPEVDNPTPNVWTLTMPVLDQEGIYWIRCQSTDGIFASRSQRLGVSDTPF